MSELSSKRLARLNTRPTGLVAALDIGCSKTTCLIARPDPDHPRRMNILGAGRQQTRGFDGGTITDMQGLERSIRLAVEDAEREAGEPISEVILGITGPKLSSRLMSGSIEISGRTISARDVRRLHAQVLARAAQLPGARQEQVLSAWPVLYTIDKAAGRVRQPVGMIAGTLSVKLSIVSAPGAIVQNLIECVGRAHLGVCQLIPSAIASGAGTLIDDEIEVPVPVKVDRVRLVDVGQRAVPELGEPVGVEGALVQHGGAPGETRGRHGRKGASSAGDFAGGGAAQVIQRP